jgi:pimeloyl-ACP methyl ester carboxylesterase
MIDKRTAFRKLGGTFPLTGDPAHTGFIVLAVQGRALEGASPGGVFDPDYTGPENVDVAATDHFIDELDGRGLLDHRRIYTAGASYGGHMAATYAMMRADRIAAFAAFATDAPRAAWSCAGPPPPAIVLYRACDGFFACESVERWLRQRDAAGAETAWVRLGAGNEEEPNCALPKKCSDVKGAANHRRWPKGREDDILRFFARHSLGPAPGAPPSPPTP